MRSRFPALLAMAVVAVVLVPAYRKLTQAVQGLSLSTADLRRATGHLTALVDEDRRARSRAQRLDPIVMDTGGCCGGGGHRAATYVPGSGGGEPVVVDVDPPQQPSAEDMARAERLKAEAAQRAGIAEA